MCAANYTVRIPGYDHAVTRFDTYGEAVRAANVALSEDDRLSRRVRSWDVEDLPGGCAVRFNMVGRQGRYL